MLATLLCFSALLPLGLALNAGNEKCPCVNQPKRGLVDTLTNAPYIVNASCPLLSSSKHGSQCYPIDFGFNGCGAHDIIHDTAACRVAPELQPDWCGNAW